MQPRRREGELALLFVSGLLGQLLDLFLSNSTDSGRTISPAEEKAFSLICLWEYHSFLFHMPKTKAQKQTILNQLAENLAKQKAMVFVNYKGLKVKDMLALRDQLKQVGSKLVIAKKTLLQKAINERGLSAGRQGIGIDLKGMEGQIGAIFAFEDSLAPMKAANTLAKSNENLKILGGYFENEIQSAASIVAIANLPSKDELLAKLVGTLAAPIAGFATVLQGNIKGLVIALNAIKDKKA